MSGGEYVKNDTSTTSTSGASLQEESNQFGNTTENVQIVSSIGRDSVTSFFFFLFVQCLVTLIKGNFETGDSRES